MLDLYRRIWRVTGRSQVLLIFLSVTVAGLAALPLQYQKDIVNGLSGDMQSRELLVLGARYLSVLLLSSALKFWLDYRGSILSEAIIRRIRTRIYRESDVGRTGKAANRGGSLITMIAAEAEEVGKFVGASISTPLMQLGTLVSVIAYVATTQPFLGILMLSIVVPQALIVLGMQRHINTEVGNRVKALRKTTDQIASQAALLADDNVISGFDEVYEARRRIFFVKLSTKFVLNTINGLGNAGILVLGGWLVITGRTDIGTVVAALTGLARISQPWRDLIAFYRNLSAVRVKYELLIAALPEERAQ